MRSGSKLVPGAVLRPVVCVVFSVLMMVAVAAGDAVAGKRKSGEIMMPAGSPAAINGPLHVCRGKRLCNEDGNPIQLRGISSHGLQWFPHCLAPRAFDAMADDWGADVVRIALYVQEGGYETNPRKFRDLVDTAIKRATRRGLYVIIDWHILTPGDPYHNLDRAKSFFDWLVKRNRKRVNVIYELANEPNGEHVTWDLVKSYHEALIPVIRKRDPDAILLLGTPGWSSMGLAHGWSEQDIIDDPVDADNVLYSFHFYAASHRDHYRQALDRAAQHIPVFVSEFGLQTYSGDGQNDLAQSARFLNVMKKRKISWAYWNFSDDWRSGAVFQPGACQDKAFDGTSRLKKSGVWIRKKMRAPDKFRVR